MTGFYLETISEI